MGAGAAGLVAGRTTGRRVVYGGVPAFHGSVGYQLVMSWQPLR